MAVLLLLGATGAAPPQALIAARASIDRGIVHLGERATYRGHVIVRPDAPVRWLVPEATEALTWGERRARRASSFEGGAAHRRRADTVSVEVPLQGFELGRMPVPGLRVEIDEGSGPRVFRLPTVTLTVVPVLTAADSNADFRAVHGPLAAPWWERVPWRWVILGLLAGAAIVALVVWWRRRRRAPAGTPVVGPDSRDPLVEALAALETLRGLNLPEHGRFAEHAFRLGQILRRYLEAVTRTTRPGDSTPELLTHLRVAGLESDDLARLSGLLRAWDQVKFAREPFTLDEAIRAERATESFLRRPAAAAAAEKVA
jgi:hypothetical protein